MRLDEAPLGTTARVGTIDASPEQRRRLAELGLRAGEHVVPLHRTSGGGRVVAVGDARIALASAVLRGIEVEPT